MAHASGEWPVNTVVKPNFDPEESDQIVVFAPAFLRLIFHPAGVKRDDEDFWNRRASPRARLEALVRWEHAIVHMCLYADKVILPSSDPSFMVDPHRKLLGGSAASLIGPEQDPQSVAIHFEYRNVARALARHDGIDILDRLRPLVDAGIIELYDPIEVYSRYVAEGYGAVSAVFSQETNSGMPGQRSSLKKVSLSRKL
jgi:hypothetical protein